MCPFCVHLTLYNLPLERCIHFIPFLSLCTQGERILIHLHNIVPWKNPSVEVNEDQLLLF